MRLLANENVPRLTVRALRAAGHDVTWVAEVATAIADRDVLAIAVREERVLLTLDKDFGELAFRARLPAKCGVVLMRVPPDPQTITALATRVLADQPCEGRFVVVEPGRIRERALPSDDDTAP